MVNSVNYSSGFAVKLRFDTLAVGVMTWLGGENLCLLAETLTV